MKLAKESWILVVISIADLIITLVLLTKGAVEANPWMKSYLIMGVGYFILVKVMFVVGPIAILEWARRHRPQFVKQMSRLAIAAYLTSYFSFMVRYNVIPLNRSSVPSSQIAAILSMGNQSSSKMNIESSSSIWVRRYWGNR